MSRFFAPIRSLLTLLLIACAMAAFGAEEPVGDAVELPLDTLQSIPVASANGNELVVAWSDRRLPLGIFVQRFGSDGKRIDAPPIRIAGAETPAIAGDVIAFSRNSNDVRRVGLVRIANNQAGEPRFVATGWNQRLFTNGRTVLLGYSDKAMLLSRDFEPVATLDVPAWVMAAAPARDGYVIVSGGNVMRIGDDGKTRDTIPIGTVYSAAIAMDGERGIVLTADGSTLRETFLDTGRTLDLARCSQPVVKSVHRTAGGYLALAQCSRSELQLVTVPPLPQNKLATLRFDANGALLDVKPVASDETRATGDVVAVDGALLAIANGSSGSANIARLTHGRLDLGAPVATGAPEVSDITLDRDGDHDLVRWYERRTEWPRIFETRVTRAGVDPQHRAVPSSNYDFPDWTSPSGEVLSKVYPLLHTLDAHGKLVLGKGEDGYMVVLNDGSTMHAFHIDPTLTHITQLPDLGEGTAQTVTRRDGYGIVVFHRKEEAAPFYGIERYYVVLTR